MRSSGSLMSKVFMPAKKTSFRSDHAYTQADLLLCEHMPLYLFCFAVARPIHLGSTELGPALDCLNSVKFCHNPFALRAAKMF